MAIKVSLTPRQLSIIDMLQDQTTLTNIELAQALQVTEQTIRKDVRLLDQAGLIERFHGGVMIKPQDQVVNDSIEVRECTLVEEKQRMAQAIADLIPQDATVFITIGTTVEQVAQYLKNKHITVITNSLRVASILYQSPDVKVFVPSGSLKPQNGGIEGPASIRSLSSFHANFVITSLGSIAEDGTLLDYNQTEVMAAQTMFENADQLIVAVDHTKFNARAPIKLGHLSEVSYLVADYIPNPKLKTFLEQSKITWIETDANKHPE